MRPVFAFLICFSLLLPGLAAAKAVAGLDKMPHYPGLFDLWWDADKGRVLMEVDNFDKDFLYLVTLPNGIGSNDIGLDRGQLGTERVVYFLRAGPKVLMIARNLEYRANTRNPAEQRAVEQAFAQSVLASFTVEGERNRGVIVDITPLLVSDAYQISARLQSVNEGRFSLNASLSSPDPTTLKSFERNSLAEAWLTYVGEQPGSELESVVPDPTHVTVKTRHHFVALPEEPLAARAYHPQAGYFSVAYRDYAVALDQAIEQRLLVRHRLQKKEPSAAVSEPVAPIVYYVDAGAPEPIRSALVEGASWWNQAFAAAGYKNAFQVKVLPADADPLDLRYNTIQWVHRSTRGWSYGSSIVDPRSGEILKGHVSLGSLRVRQDMLIAEALTSPFGADGDQGQAVQAMALARLRQLSAHEVGHTLGLAHNFFASANNDASVMDYPHPKLSLDSSGQVSLANAYATGIGAWDKLAIAYGYSDFASGTDEAEALAAIINKADAQGLRFISDPDVRGPATAHAGAHLWDNGPDVLAEFDNLMQVRRAALAHFSDNALRPGQAMGDLELTLVPLYLLHRYQAEAVAKLIGGVDYDYALHDAEQTAVRQVPVAQQKAALAALIASLRPSELTLRSELLPLLHPPAYGYSRTREAFQHLTANAFDSAAPARAAAQLVVGMLLDSRRAERLLQQTQLNSNQLGLFEALHEIGLGLVLPANGADSGSDQITLAVAWVTLRELQRLAVDPAASDSAKAATLAELTRLQKQLKRGDQAQMLAAEIKRFLAAPSAGMIPGKVVVPPGSPI